MNIIDRNECSSILLSQLTSISSIVVVFEREKRTKKYDLQKNSLFFGCYVKTRNRQGEAVYPGNCQRFLSSVLFSNLFHLKA